MLCWGNSAASTGQISPPRTALRLETSPVVTTTTTTLPGRTAFFEEPSKAWTWIAASENLVRCRRFRFRAHSIYISSDVYLERTIRSTAVHNVSRRSAEPTRYSARQMRSTTTGSLAVELQAKENNDVHTILASYFPPSHRKSRRYQRAR